MRPVRMMSEAQLRQAYAVRHAAHMSVAPDDPFAPYPQWASMVSLAPAHLRRWHWLVDGGYADLTVSGSDSTGHLELWVEPAKRRRGIGSALLTDVRDAAADVGCDLVIGRFGDACGRSFALARGAASGNSTVRSLLSLPGVVAEVPPVLGCSVLSWVDRTPPELLGTYAEARNAINDAPHTDGVEDEAWTAERVRDFEEVVIRRGRQTRVTVVLDGAVVIGFTELRVSPEPDVTASTEDTATVAEHRGRGVAAWAKATSLALLGQDRPDVIGVTTSNDATNVAMLAVNRRLGFRPVATWTDAVFAVDR